MSRRISFEIGLGIALYFRSRVVYPNSRISIPKGRWQSQKSENHEKQGFGDFNPSKLDLTSAPWSRTMPPPFWKSLLKISSIKMTQKRTHAMLYIFYRGPSRAAIGAGRMANLHYPVDTNLGLTTSLGLRFTLLWSEPIRTASQLPRFLRCSIFQGLYERTIKRFVLHCTANYLPFLSINCSTLLMRSNKCYWDYFLAE